MNKWLTTVSAALFALTFSTTAFAHSYLDSSTPTDGETVTASLQEINLSFNGKIEQGSYFDIQNAAGTAITVDEFIINDSLLTGTFTEALPNDDYTVNWSIISADGHPLEGTFSFNINAPEPVVEAPVTEEVTAKEETAANEVEAVEDQPTTDSEQSSNVGPIAAIVLAVIGLGVIIARRKK